MNVGAHLRTIGAWVLGAGLVLSITTPNAAAQDSFTSAMRFAADMAKRGNWREAKFRWEMAAELDPDNPRVLNNLGVAQGALGHPDVAREFYARAFTLSHGAAAIDANRMRADRFWSQVEQVGDGSPPTYDRTGSIPADPDDPSRKKSGKTFKATVRLPVPPRFDLGDRSVFLVASFLTDESALLDINRELVRFVRSEYRKHTELEILAIRPAPAVPEQRLSDLIANSEFWKHLGREYGADVIVSGVMGYDRQDASGFRDVDIISPTTGQKVRQSQFVEQERFDYDLDIIFMDGVTGALLFQDRLQRQVLFRGTQNDPITAFYELSDSIVADILAIVRPRTREDVRFVFKK